MQASTTTEFLPTKKLIRDALPKIGKGLEQYLAIQKLVHHVNVATDEDFQRKFNGFYRVRRNAEWRSCFYAMFEREKKGKRARPFERLLREFQKSMGRIEGSFISKMLATLDDEQPVMDSIVLKHCGLRMPAYGAVERRLNRIVENHDALRASLIRIRDAELGQFLVSEFKRRYPDAQISEIKMVDLVLWQTRSQ
ncbi:MAG: hypothetical protein KDA59_02105 [Planctomycetales bacterium]|nr:hypothetical protein [Planctomycetales bacterium]